MKRALVLLAVICVAPSAGAEPRAHESIGDRSVIAFVLDGLFGLSHSSYSSSPASVPDSGDPSSVNIGTPSNSLGVSGARFGVHGFVTPRVSIGASVGFYHRSEKVESTSVSLSPRLGFVIPIGTSSAIWLRAGAGYQHQAPVSAFSVGGEAQYVSTPFGHFGWTFGPSFETDVSAKQTSNGRTGNASRRTTIGVAFGVLFDF